MLAGGGCAAAIGLIVGLSLPIGTSSNNKHLILTFRGPDPPGLDQMLVYDYSVSSDRKSVNATYLRNITFLRNGRKSTLLRGLAATNDSHKVAFATALANPAITPSNAIELVDICSPSPQASEELSPDWNFFSADVSNANAVAASPDGKWLCFSNQTEEEGQVVCGSCGQEQGSEVPFTSCDRGGADQRFAVPFPRGISFNNDSSWLFVASASGDPQVKGNVTRYNVSSSGIIQDEAVFNEIWGPRDIFVSKDNEVYVASIKGKDECATGNCHDSGCTSIKVYTDSLKRVYEPNDERKMFIFNGLCHDREPDPQGIFVDETNGILLVASRAWFSVEYFDVETNEHLGSVGGLEALQDQPEGILLVDDCVSAPPTPYESPAPTTPTPPPPTPRSIAQEEFAWLVFGVVGAVTLAVLVLVGFMCRVRRRKRKNHDENMYGGLFKNPNTDPMLVHNFEDGDIQESFGSEIGSRKTKYKYKF